MNWRINRDHVIRLIDTDSSPWRYQPVRHQITQMLRMQEKIENLESQSREFILTLPHHRDTLTIWSSEFEYIRKEFNSMSFEDLTTKILELEHKMEHQTPHFYPELTRILLYHYQESEVWRLKDMRSLKYVVDQLPRWEELKNDTKLMQALFK